MQKGAEQTKQKKNIVFLNANAKVNYFVYFSDKYNLARGFYTKCFLIN